MKHRRRKTLAAFFISACIAAAALYQATRMPAPAFETKNSTASAETELASTSLEKLEVKGRAPKTGYSRSQFGDGWAEVNNCDTRDVILQRDLEPAKIDSDGCRVVRGVLLDPYTGHTVDFVRGEHTSSLIQIDHVVALSDAWQKGAQQISPEQREQFANDGLNLLAVDGPANMNKGDGDSATWLPPNKYYRCQYVSRQVAVKLKYHLWVTLAEKDAIKRILNTCPDQHLPYEGTF